MDNSNRSTASGAQVVANNGGNAQDNRDQSTTDNSDRSTTNKSDSSTRASGSGTGSVSNGGDASYSDSSNTQMGSSDAGTGAAATTNQFGASAVVSSANLASYVTGVTVSYAVPSGGGASSSNSSLSTGDGAFTNFAGIQSLNMNTGVAASQNSAVNLSVSAGAINLNR
jgi:hypothetical protein